MLLLGGLVVSASTARFSETPGIDFYQLWGVAAAQRWAPDGLGSPYVEAPRYAAVLEARARASSDPRFEAASQRRRELDLTATPLLYASFRLLPDDYSLAFGIFQTLQLLLFTAAAIAIGRLRGASTALCTGVALLLIATFQPLIAELRVGNVACLQLFALVALTALADAGHRAQPADASLLREAALLSGLAILTLLKPNLVAASLLLAAHVWTVRGTRVFLVAAAGAAPVTALALALPCVLFGSWGVWLDWWRTVFSDPARLVYPVSQGNYASPLLLAAATGLDASRAGLGIAVALAATTVARTWTLRPPEASGLAALLAFARGRLRDPWWAAATGVVVIIALSPLVWAHYYVLCLFPALWLLWSSPRRGWPGWLAAASILMMSALLFQLIPPGGWAGVLPRSLSVPWNALIPASVAAGWVPLWAALLVVAPGATRREPAA